jgi:F0F1-type ATP synthase assembly protein I
VLADATLHRQTCKVFKLVVGILKGAIIGGALGYGAFALADATGFASPWLTYGVVGALVGLIAGRPIWSLLRDKNATAWVAILKGAFGFGVGCGLYALLAKVWNPSAITVGDNLNIFTWPVTVGGAIGGLYGAFVELDDAIGDDKKPASESARPGTAPGATKASPAAAKAKGAPPKR